MSKYLSVEYLLISKATSTLASAVQKIDFWGPILGGFSVELLQKISGEKIAFAAQQLYTSFKFQVSSSLALRTRFGSQHQLLPMRESFLLGNTITSFRCLTVKSIFSCWEHGMPGLCQQALTDSCTTGSLKQ